MADLSKDPKYEAESTGVCMLTKVSGIATECPAPHAAQAQVDFWDLPVSPLPEARTGFDDAASVHSMDSGVYDTWEHLQEWETLATELAAVGYIPDPENIAALCADRVTQMTKTYNDIDSVTHLLEEKERDLELAARIGQSLLEKNKDLSEQHNDDVQELIDAREKISQLKHDVSMKDALLRIYVQDYDLEEHGAPIQKSDDRVIALQRKSELLQEENAKLKNEAGLLRDETDDLEEQEASLVSSCVGQLQELQLQLLVQEEDLATKNEVLVRQQEEVTSLMQANIHLTGKNNKLVVENAELQQHLDATKSTQRELVMELKELEERYAELSALYQEAQDEIKALRRKQKPLATPSQLSSYSPFLPADSLAMELQDSIRKDTSPEPASQRKCNSKRVMDTVRCVRGATSRSGHQTSSAESGESLVVSPTCSSMYMSEGESMISDDFDLGAAEQISSTPLPTKLGRPGIPGSNDLETALRRLSLRKANEINDKIFQDVQSRKTHSDDRITEDGSDSCRSPDSYMSTGSGGSNLSALSSRSSQAYRRPQKLQIIKPLEGSLTLYQWQRLATPHLGGVLESRPGIQIKGQEPLALPQPQYYSLSDVEEDDGMLIGASGGRQAADLAAIREREPDNVLCMDQIHPPPPSPNSSQESTGFMCSINAMTIIPPAVDACRCINI